MSKTIVTDNGDTIEVEIFESGVTLNAGTGGALLSGTGVPNPALGSNTDYYIDKTSNILYGPKTAGEWGTGISLVGPSGLVGTRLAVIGFLQVWKADLEGDYEAVEINDIIDGFDEGNSMRKVTGIVKDLPWNTYDAATDSYPNIKAYINTTHGS
jgi:hypothetical protein